MERDVVLACIGITGILWYYACLIQIGWRPLPSDPPPTNFRAFQSLSVTTIGVSLATFVGMMLGIQSVAANVQKNADVAVKKMEEKNQAKPDQQQDEEAIQKNVEAFRHAAGIGSAMKYWVQWSAVIAYVASLFLALFFWWRSGNETDPVISNLGRSLLGLFAGSSAVLLVV